jgi:hypothetical protein
MPTRHQGSEQRAKKEEKQQKMAVLASMENRTAGLGRDAFPWLDVTPYASEMEPKRR